MANFASIYDGYYALRQHPKELGKMDAQEPIY